MRGSNLSAAGRALALMRVALGGIFLLAASGKMAITMVFGFIPLPTASYAWQFELPERLSGWLAMHSSGIPAAVVRDIVVPHGALFAGFIAWLQLLIGFALVVGFATRAAAIGAGALAVIFTFAAKSGALGGSRFYVILGIIAFAVMMGDAGKTFGIDGWRSSRRRGEEF